MSNKEEIIKKYLQDILGRYNTATLDRKGFDFYFVLMADLSDILDKINLKGK